MSDNAIVTKDELIHQSLVPFTDILDVRLLKLSAEAPEEPDTLGESLNVELSFANPAFRAKRGELQVLLPVKVTYTFEANRHQFSPGSSSDSEADNAAKTQDNDALASMSMVFRVDLELNRSVDPEDLDKDIISEFVDSNLIFMIYPYVRSTVQRISGEMPFPHTVLPYLRRGN